MSNTINDRWTNRLSEYLDDELDASERAEMEAHLSGCTGCSETLAELRLVLARARSLPARRPEEDLWPLIEARITGRVRMLPARIASWSERRVSFSVPQIAAACVAVAVVSGAAVWFARTSGLHEAGRLIPTSISTEAMLAQAPDGGAEATGAGIEELRRALAAREDLDPATAQTLEENLRIIEIAIRQSRRALEADPRNPYVRAHLDETMRRKVDLLRRATMLASAPR